MYENMHTVLQKITEYHRLRWPCLFAYLSKVALHAKIEIELEPHQQGHARPVWKLDHPRWLLKNSHGHHGHWMTGICPMTSGFLRFSRSVIDHSIIQNQNITDQLDRRTGVVSDFRIYLVIRVYYVYIRTYPYISVQMFIPRSSICPQQLVHICPWFMMILVL